MALVNKTQVLAAFILAVSLVAYSAEAVRICKSRSETYHYPQCKTTLCITTCINESFTSGYCKHKGTEKEKCMCTKECGGDEPPSPPEPPEPPAAMGVAN